MKWSREEFVSRLDNDREFHEALLDELGQMPELEVEWMNSDTKLAGYKILFQSVPILWITETTEKASHWGICVNWQGLQASLAEQWHEIWRNQLINANSQWSFVPGGLRKVGVQQTLSNLRKLIAETPT